jgi:hypothetical protein
MFSCDDVGLLDAHLLTLVFSSSSVLFSSFLSVSSFASGLNSFSFDLASAVSHLCIALERLLSATSKAALALIHFRTIWS